MKKWIYLAFPGVMLALFLVVWFAHEKDADARDKQRLEAKAKKLEDEKQAKAAAEKKAREEAAQRQKEREEEDRKKEDERRAKQAKADKEVKDAYDAAVAEGDRYQKELNNLEVELDRLHKAKDLASRQAFDLAKQVELARVAKRNAELEEQRMTDMIARRAAESTMAAMPPPPPPPPAAK
jgi:hypothetical protein